MKVSKTISFELKVWENLIDHCDKNSLNRSAVVQKLVEQYLKNKGAN